MCSRTWRGREQERVGACGAQCGRVRTERGCLSCSCSVPSVARDGPAWPPGRVERSGFVAHGRGFSVNRPIGERALSARPGAGRPECAPGSPERGGARRAGGSPAESRRGPEAALGGRGHGAGSRGGAPGLAERNSGRASAAAGAGRLPCVASVSALNPLSFAGLSSRQPSAAWHLGSHTEGRHRTIKMDFGSGPPESRGKPEAPHPSF